MANYTDDFNGTNQTKSKYWATIFYTDSTPNKFENVIKPLSKHFVKFVISPLHNGDIKDVETGEIKKEHYHVLMLFDTPKTYNQIEWLINQTTCVGQELVLNKQAYYDYLTHKNEIDKTHYNENDLLYFGCKKTEFVSDTDKVFYISDFITSNNIKSISKLIQALKNYDSTLLSIVKSNSYLIHCLINENKEN